MESRSYYDTQKMLDRVSADTKPPHHHNNFPLGMNRKERRKQAKLEKKKEKEHAR